MIQRKLVPTSSNDSEPISPTMPQSIMLPLGPNPPSTHWNKNGRRMLAPTCTRRASRKFFHSARATKLSAVTTT